MSYIDQMLEKLSHLSDEDRATVLEASNEVARGRKFIPHPGPQTEAYFSEADVLLYGGQAGGGKTGLLCGLALEEHTNSLLMRRKFTDLQGGGGLIDELLKMYGTRKGFNGASPPTLRTADGRVVTFGGANIPGDEMAFAGRARDFLGIDEATQFTRSQIELLMGWVRTTKAGQRTRTILATNPPLTTDGDWVISMFAPWLDPTHENPAEPGELRWYVRNEEGEDIEVEGPEPIALRGSDRLLHPKSRTFIPAALSDNPFIDEGYRTTLDNLPPAIRAALRDGNFAASRMDAEWQMIPTEWVRQAFGRWTPVKPNVPMCAIGADVSGDGPDRNMLAVRYDGWYDELIPFKGKDYETGPARAGKIMMTRKNGAKIILDMGGGYGSTTYEQLRENGIDVVKFVGSKSSPRTTRDNTLGFGNIATEAYWRFREALDPSQDGGSTIALPYDQELLGELTSWEYEVRSGKIFRTPKEKIKEKLGRSPDKSDAVVMAWWAGNKNLTHGQIWRKAAEQVTGSGRNKPRVILGRSMARRRS